MEFFTFVTDAFAMGPAPQGTQPGGVQGLIASLLPLILIFVIFYFLLIRPQQKKAKEHKQMLDNLKRGDKVITVGGLYGLVEAVTDTTVTLKIAENTKVKVAKAYIAALRTDNED